MRLDFQPRFSKMVHRNQETNPSAASSLADAAQGWPLLRSIAECQWRVLAMTPAAASFLNYLDAELGRAGQRSA